MITKTQTSRLLHEATRRENFSKYLVYTKGIYEILLDAILKEQTTKQDFSICYDAVEGYIQDLEDLSISDFMLEDELNVVANRVMSCLYAVGYLSGYDTKEIEDILHVD